MRSGEDCATRQQFGYLAVTGERLAPAHVLEAAVGGIVWDGGHVAAPGKLISPLAFAMALRISATAPRLALQTPHRSPPTIFVGSGCGSIAPRGAAASKRHQE